MLSATVLFRCIEYENRQFLYPIKFDEILEQSLLGIRTIAIDLG